MIDFVLENSSPLVRSGVRPALSSTMGNFNTKPDLVNFVSALSNLLKRYPTVDLNENDDEPMNGEETPAFD